MLLGAVFWIPGTGVHAYALCCSVVFCLVFCLYLFLPVHVAPRPRPALRPGLALLDVFAEAFLQRLGHHVDP